MRVPVYVLLCDDPRTNIAAPVSVNEDRAVVEQVKAEMIDTMGMTSSILPPAQRQQIARTLRTLRIVEAVMEYDDYA